MQVTPFGLRPGRAAGWPRNAAAAGRHRPQRLAAILRLGLLSVMVVTGCVAANPSSSDITYYMLEYESPRPDGRQPLPVVLGVERLQVSPHTNSDRILYREKDFRRESYHYHRWRANPGDLVTDFLIRDLRNSGRFKAVIGSGHRLGTTHTIEGTVEEFYEADDPDRWRAVLSLTIILVDNAESNRALSVLFQKDYTTSKPCRQRNPRAVAEAMSGALAELSRQILEDVTSALDPRAESNI
jgi:cholesterol transport system auxiliary component